MIIKDKTHFFNGAVFSGTLNRTILDLIGELVFWEKKKFGLLNHSKNMKNRVK